MGNNMFDKVINLWDLFWAVCLKWRMICFCAILAATVTACFSYLSSAGMGSEQQTSAQIKQRDELNEEDQVAVKIYLEYLEAYNSQFQYNTESPLMCLDANGFYLSTLNYYVDNHFSVEYPLISKTNNVYAMIRAYQASLDDDSFREKLQNEWDETYGEASAYVAEQVDCNNLYGSRLNSNSTIGIMSVSVYGSSEEMCRNLAAIVKETLNEKTQELSRQFGDHDLILTEETYNFVSDNELLAYQKNNIDRLYNCGRSLSDVKKMMSDEAQSYIEQVSAESSQTGEVSTSDDTQTASVSGGKVRISKKKICIGGIAGAFAAIMIAAFAYLVNNRLLYEDDLEKLFGLKLFGRIEKQKKKRLLGIVDDFILKLRRKNIPSFDQAEVVEMIYTGVKLAAEKNQIHKIYVTGAGGVEVPMRSLDEIVKKLKKDGIQLELGKSILYYAGALEQSAKIGNILLLEKAGKSSYLEIQREIEICMQQEMHVLGAVVIE